VTEGEEGAVICKEICRPSSGNVSRQAQKINNAFLHVQLVDYSSSSVIQKPTANQQATSQQTYQRQKNREEKEKA
jgi:hypothetical protein